MIRRGAREPPRQMTTRPFSGRFPSTEINEYRAGRFVAWHAALARVPWGLSSKQGGCGYRNPTPSLRRQGSLFNASHAIAAARCSARNPSSALYYPAAMYSRSDCASRVVSSMQVFTTSPIETIPLSRPSSTTGM